MVIALISLDQIWENKDANKIKCAAFIKKAANHQVDLIIFPEMTLTGFSMNVEYTSEDFQNSQTLRWFQEMSELYKINIVLGYVQSYDHKALNNLIAVSQQGQIISTYSKIHPFSFANENDYFISGDSLSVWSLNGYRIGSSICYDLRFPVLYQALSKQGCEIIINIANWPEKRIMHWNTLLSARAIENQAYMIGVNRIGKDGYGVSYCKSSQIFNPEGKEVIPIYSEDEYDLYKIEPEFVNKLRNDFPVHKDRKYEFYKRVL